MEIASDCDFGRRQAVKCSGRDLVSLSDLDPQELRERLEAIVEIALKNVGGMNGERNPDIERIGHRKAYWKKVVFRRAGVAVAGIAAYAVATSAGITTNVLTTPDAGAALLENLRAGWEVIASSLKFSGGV